MNTVAENNELITSTDVERMIKVRSQLIERAKRATEELADIKATMQQYYNYFGFSYASRDGVEMASNPMPMIEKNIDKAMWGYLMDKTNMFNLMDHKTKDKFRKDLENPPALTKESVEATFKQLFMSRDDIFENGVINLFKNLSWCYKTNLPQKFGKRVVKSHYCEPAWSRGFNISWGRGRDELVDLERIMLTLDKKTLPEANQTLPERITSHSQSTGSSTYADDYVSIKMYKNRNMHIEFKRPDLVEQMNRVLAKHYPGALPAPK